jgi:hypothetical protein
MPVGRRESSHAADGSILRGINPAGAERMAAAEPPDPFGSPPDWTVFSDRLEEVVAAGRLKTAAAPHNWAQSDLIDPDQPKQDRRQHSSQH